MIEALETWSLPWARVTGLALLQNTLWLGLILLVLRRLERAPASLRYAVALLGLLKLLLPPFLRMPATAAKLQPVVASLGTLEIPWVDAAPTASKLAAGHGPAVALMVCWACGVFLSLLLSALGSLRLAARLRGARRVPPEELPGMPRDARIGVYRSEGIRMPLIHGVFPRRIYVPAQWDRWPRSVRNMILRHELAHIRRADGLVRALQTLVRALYFYHPLVHLLLRKLDETREMACDEASLSPGERSALDYSRFLLTVAESLVTDAPACESASALMRRKDELLNRVRYLMKGAHMNSYPRRRGILVLAALLLLVLPLSFGGDHAWSLDQAGESGRAGTLSAGGKSAGAVTIALAPDGALSLDRRAVDETELAKFLDELSSKSGEHAVILLDCDPATPMAKLFELQRSLIARNLTRVKYLDRSGQGQALRLPALEGREKLERLASEDLAVLRITERGAVLLDGRKLPGAKLGAAVEGRLMENPHLVLSIETESGTAYGAFVQVLAQAKAAGAMRIAVLPPKTTAD